MGFRGVSEGPKPRILICGPRCLYVSFCIGAQKCHFAWFKSVLTTCLTGLEMVSQGFQTGFRESSELFQIDVKGVKNSGCFYLV